jgi:polyphosphate kinase 2 (PPK2 family)
LTFFNRSHYEEVLVARVMKLVPEERWKRRFEHINAWEKMLVDEGTTIVKIFLHISKEEQKERLQQRLDDPSKNWKFDPRDLEARARWEEYREAYEEVLEKTSTGHAPWYVVPADKKWYRDLAMAELMVKTLEKVNPKYPKPGFDVEKMVSK